MKIGPVVSELLGVENRLLTLTRPMAYTTACTNLTSRDRDATCLLSRAEIFEPMQLLAMCNKIRQLMYCLLFFAFVILC